MRCILKPRSPGGEVKLLVVERVVGDVHLAIDVDDVVLRGVACVVEDGGSVVVQPRRAAFKEAGDECDLVVADDFGKSRGAGAGDGFRDAEEFMLFALAEVLRAEEFGQADELCAAFSGFTYAGDCLGEVGLGGRLAGHLDEGYAGGGHYDSLILLTFNIR